MSAKTAKKAFLLLFCLSLCGACGKLDTMLSPEGTYQIRTQVNGVFLDNFSLVYSGDSIRPYCNSSIANDPDITELLLYFKNSQGEKTGAEIRYMIKLYADTYLQIDENPVVIETEPEPEYPENERETEILDESTAETSTGSTETALNASNRDKIIIVKRFERNLPSFPMPGNMEIGEYTLVIQIMGGKETLGEIEQGFFYLGKTEFALKDIQLYLPGVFSGSRLIPPGTSVLLEAKVEADERLNPYIVWYNSKKVIQEGRLSEGAGTVFWTVPDQTGFQTFKAEIFPSPQYQGMGGVSKEIILPVSTKAANAGFFAHKTAADFALPLDASAKPENAPAGGPDPVQPALLHWYQFAGTLYDSNNPLATEKTLTPVEGLPRWRPMDYSYGLATGPSDAYLLPPVSFIPEDEQKGGSLFLLRAKSLANGKLLSAVYPMASGERVRLDLAYKDSGLVLSLSSGESYKESSIPLADADSHICTAVAVYLYGGHIEAKLIPEKSVANQNCTLKLKAEGLNGRCRISIGDSDDAIFSERPDASESEDQARSRKQKLPETAIWNEFAVFYLIPPDEPEFVESEIAEAEAAEPEIAEAESKKTKTEGDSKETANDQKAKSPVPEGEGKTELALERTEKAAAEAKDEPEKAMAEEQSAPETEPAFVAELLPENHHAEEDAIEFIGEFF